MRLFRVFEIPTDEVKLKCRYIEAEIVDALEGLPFDSLGIDTYTKDWRFRTGYPGTGSTAFTGGVTYSHPVYSHDWTPQVTGPSKTVQRAEREEDRMQQVEHECPGRENGNERIVGINS